MRVLQISSARTCGGGEKHLVDLARGLAERGHEVFAALRRDNEWEDRLVFLPGDNIRRLPLRNALDVPSARELARIVRRERIDIVHAHLARDYPVAALAARLAPEAELVLTRHVLFPLKRIHRLTLANTARVIAVSGAVAANLRKVFPEEKIALIPNGIETGRFAADREGPRREFRFFHNIPFDARLVGTVGELKKLKGQEDFILAAGEIAKRTAETHFLVVGKDNSLDRAYRRKLKRLVKVLELEENLTFLDWVEDTGPLLAALDVFVSPSHSESFGLAILEAMAAGTPVVATATEGARELLTEDVSGRLTPPGEPVALAGAVCELLADPDAASRLAGEARRRARENYGLERMVAETERLYEEILREAGVTGAEET